MGQIEDLRNQVQVEAALEANHMSCYVEKKLRKENMQKYMLPSAASRLDKVAEHRGAENRTFSSARLRSVLQSTVSQRWLDGSVEEGVLGYTITSFLLIELEHMFWLFLAWQRSTERGLEK